MPSPEIAAWLQVALLVIGFVSLAMKIGKREAELSRNSETLDELSEIVKDLVRFQVAAETSNHHIREMLADIRKRLDRLESLRRDAGRGD